MAAFPWDQFGLVSIDLSRKHWQGHMTPARFSEREGAGLHLLILFRRPRRGVQMVVSSGGYGNRLAERGRHSCEVTLRRGGAHAEIPGDVRVRRPRMTLSLLLTWGVSSHNAVLEGCPCLCSGVARLLACRTQ